MSKENTTLFDLVGAIQELYEIADDPDVEPEVWNDTFEAVEGEFEVKAEKYACLIAKLIGECKTIKEQETRLYERRKAMENSVQRIKSHLQEAMEATGKTKFKTAMWSFGIRKNTPAVVLDTEISKIPPQYLKFAEPTVDKKLLKDDILNGEKLDGIAHLEASESLIIK